MRGEVRVDAFSVASGAVIAALGALVLFDSSGAVDLSLGWVAVALTGAVGAILVLSGLTNGGGRRQDSER